MSMNARVKWLDNMTFIGESGSGHGLVMDAKPQFGGRNLGPSPMELVLLGAGGCTAIDMASILKKSREAVDDIEVQLSAERAEDHPKVFTNIAMHFVVKGRDLKEKTVERAIKLSAEKYCSASIMLGKTAAITHTFEIEDTGA